MKTILRKLKSKAGESLIESLAAILIFTMASIVMYSMVTTAGDLNLKAKQMDQTNQKHMVAVEKGLKQDEHGVDIINGSATVSFSLENGTTVAQAKVDIYGGRNGSLYTYFLQPPSQPVTGGAS